MFKDVLKLFVNPITLTLDYAKKATIKSSFILSAIIAGVLAILNSINFVISTIITKEYSYYERKYTTKVDFSNFQFGDFIKNFFTFLIVVFVILLILAAIMYIISRILKNENNFSKLLTISAISSIPYAFSIVIVLLTSWLYAPIGIFAEIAASLYMQFIIIYSFRNTLTIEDEDKLTMYNVILILIVVIVTFYIFLNRFFSGLSSFASLIK